MVYRLGIVGVGHWAERLQKSMATEKIAFHKALDISTFEEKKKFLDSFCIDASRYYQISPGAALPKEFFHGIDIAQIASPVQYHKSQTIQALESGKRVVTEKSFAANRDDFNEVADFLRDGGYENNLYVHLHYLRKMPTMRLASMLQSAIKEYGNITSVNGTFFEDYREEDRRRKWLFRPENGGIFLDWIHPVEVIARGCGANFKECLDAKTFVITPDYGEYPSGALGTFTVSGKNFAAGATATISVGKGFQSLTHKVLRINFESAFLDLAYMDSEREIITGQRGSVRLVELDGHKTILYEHLKGPIAYDFLIDDMVRLCQGTQPHLLLPEMSNIFDPVWMFNEAAKDPVTNANDVAEFTKSGVDRTLFTEQTIYR
ncbi:MAG: Gfo/Idh/MocA family oxidoreductase [Candidatus Aenigmarchaeota archaeon]|nr:Gfo/Idh/MocA family oxidoreductase [Candidatus Aenigmarchaeota archaeon]